MAKLGFIGLGVMGGRIAKRLMDNGHEVTGFNRTKSKADWLINEGMFWVESPKAVALASDVVFSMVTDSEALLAITSGSDGVLEGLKSGKTYVEMSTVAPIVSQKIAAKVATLGAFMLDSPVSGSVETLEAGKLSIMVGGDKKAFEKVKPFLIEIAPKAANYIGGNGLAVAMKIAINLSLAVQMLAFSEGILLAEKMGVKRKVATDVMFNSVIASPMIKYRGPFILNMPEEAWFNVHMMQKDMNLALDLGLQLGISMPTTKVTNDFLESANRMGLGKEDFAIVFEALKRISDVPDDSF